MNLQWAGAMAGGSMVRPAPFKRLLSFFLSFFCAIRWLEKRKIGAVSGVAALASWLNTRRSVTTVNRLLIIEQNCSVYPWHGICCIIRNRRRTKMTGVDAMATPRRDAAGPVWMFVSFLHHHFKPWLTWLQAPIKIAFVLAHENCLETRRLHHQMTNGFSIRSVSTFALWISEFYLRRDWLTNSKEPQGCPIGRGLFYNQVYKLRISFLLLLIIHSYKLSWAKLVFFIYLFSFLFF